MNETHLKEYSRDVEYIKELLNIWEKADIQYKSNILYEFYFYKNKFEETIEYSKEYEITDKFIVEELKVTLHALNVLIDSLTNAEIKQIYEQRNREKSKTARVDKLKYGRKEENKFKGYIERKEIKVKQKPAVKFYYKQIVYKVILCIALILIILTGLIGKTTDKIVQVIFSAIQAERNTIIITDVVMMIISTINIVITMLAIITTILLSLKIALDLLQMAYPNILSFIGFKKASKAPYMSDDLKEAIQESENSKHEVEVQTEIKKSDKLLMVDELLNTLNNKYKEHTDILNNLKDLSVGIKSKQYKDRYNSYSKIENYYNYLLKTEDCG